VKVVLLVGVTAAAWAATAAAVAALDGPGHWLPSGVAAGLCLLPAVGTMIALRVTEHRSPVAAIGAVLLAPLARLAAVLVIGFGLWQSVPAFREAPGRFWAWVLGFYLFTLAAETALLLARPSRPAAPGGA
jgi:hypothetical protein